MKVRVTERKIKENYQNIISVGYCDIQHLLTGQEPRFYTCGVYGWNADIYEINENTVIVTGYRPFGNIHASYIKICKKYEDKARKIRNNWDIDYKKQVQTINKLLKKFVAEALEGEKMVRFVNNNEK